MEWTRIFAQKYFFNYIWHRRDCTDIFILLPRLFYSLVESVTSRISLDHSENQITFHTQDTVFVSANILYGTNLFINVLLKYM